MLYIIFEGHLEILGSGIGIIELIQTDFNLLQTQLL
jgi:hypothetical protein